MIGRGYRPRRVLACFCGSCCVRRGSDHAAGWLGWSSPYKSLARFYEIRYPQRSEDTNIWDPGDIHAHVRWLDHLQMVRIGIPGFWLSWAYVAEPYDFDAADAEDEFRFLNSQGWDIHVSEAEARHMPGFTTSIRLSRAPEGHTGVTVFRDTSRICCSRFPLGHRRGCPIPKFLKMLAEIQEAA